MSSAMTPFSVLVFGALLLAKGGLGEKGAFEKILDINQGKGLFETYVKQLLAILVAINNVNYKNCK